MIFSSGAQCARAGGFIFGLTFHLSFIWHCNGVCASWDCVLIDIETPHRPPRACTWLVVGGWVRDTIYKQSAQQKSKLLGDFLTSRGLRSSQKPGVQPRPIRSLQTAPRRVWPLGQIIIRELGTSAFKRRAARHRRVVGILNDQVRSSGVTRLQDRTFNRGPVYLIQKTNLYVNWGYTATPGHLCG